MALSYHLSVLLRFIDIFFPRIPSCQVIRKDFCAMPYKHVFKTVYERCAVRSLPPVILGCGVWALLFQTHIQHCNNWHRNEAGGLYPLTQIPLLCTLFYWEICIGLATHRIKTTAKRRHMQLHLFVTISWASLCSWLLPASCSIILVLHLCISLNMFIFIWWILINLLLDNR